MADRTSTQSGVTMDAEPEKKKHGGARGGAYYAKQNRDRKTGKIAKLKISHEACYNYFLGLGPTAKIAALHEYIVHEQGIHVAEGTLRTWCAKYKWIPRRDAAIAGIDPSRTTARLLQLDTISKSVELSTMDGLIAKWIETIDRSLDAVPVKDPDDVVTMVKGLDHLIKVKKDFRGAMTPAEPKKPQKVADSASSDLPDDVPQIGDFSVNVVKGGDVD